MEFKQLDRIFHLGDTIFLANTYIHTSKEREKQMDFMPFNCVGRLCLVFPFQNCGSLTVFVRQVIMICGYVTGFEELFKSNQIDSVIK